jgi:hypothetical protein
MSKPFWWFKGASVTELTERLNATPNARLEVHLDGEKMTLVVAPDGFDAASAKAPLDPPINESFICPPRCP